MPASADVGVVGLSFGRVADDYERLRPEHAPEAVARVVDALGLDGTSTVLDLGAGTGKLARGFRPFVGHVIAVEPDDAMRAKVDGDARAGTAEAIPVEDASVDAVVVGDAFHWFDTAAAISEIRRVLRPGGGLALFFNSWAIPESGEARDLLDAPWRRFHQDDAVDSTWYEELEAAFGPLHAEEWERELLLDGDSYARLCVTASCPSALPDDEREELTAALRTALSGENRVALSVKLWWVAT